MYTTKIEGFITCRLEEDQCEVISLDSFCQCLGVGSQLLKTVIEVARGHGCRRVWLITTNDNLNALGFYQRRGWRLVAVYPDAIAVSREQKPGIPMVGMNHIPLRDELELEIFC